MKENITNEEKNKDYEILKDLLDKQLEIERAKQKRTPAWKVVVYVFVGILTTGFFAFSCFMMYNQSFTMETLLAVLLSFFSIALSIMFYIQSEKSSSTYYMRSYEIMKDVSVALGKIETGFGEKLSNIKEHMAKIEIQKEEVEGKLEQGEREEKDIKTKITEHKISADERKKLVEELQEKTRENQELRSRLEFLQRRRRMLVEENSMMKEKMQNQENMLNDIMMNKKFRNIITHEKVVNDDEIF